MRLDGKLRPRRECHRAQPMAQEVQCCGTHAHVWRNCLKLKTLFERNMHAYNHQFLTHLPQQLSLVRLGGLVAGCCAMLSLCGFISYYKVSIRPLHPFSLLPNSMSSSQDVSRKGRKKALLIAVRKVKEIDVPLPRTHYDIRELKELLISEFFLLYADTCGLTHTLTSDQYGYAENDIIMLLDDGKLDRPFWSSDVNIVSFNWICFDASILTSFLGQEHQMARRGS
jgi:hypothetical protein